MTELYVHAVKDIKIAKIIYWNEHAYCKPYYSCKIEITTTDGKDIELTLFSDFTKDKPYDFSTLANLPAVEISKI